MECKICHVEIPRGKGYKGERFKSEHFCSVECYNKRVEQSENNKKKFKPKEGTDRRKLTDLIQSIYGEDANWPMIMMNLKSIEQEYNLTDNDFRLTIKYAVEYEDFIPNTFYGLYQFVNFIEPSQKFAKAILKSRQEEIPDEEIYVVKKQSNKKVWRER